jgi:bacillithiol biosynthesis cysteine-adding enzyme BshC
MLIDFSEIPGTSELFLDYMNDFEKVAKYYKINFRNEAGYSALFEKVTSRENPNKSELVRIINDQYKNFTTSDKTKQNVELLNDEKTIAVFTGQQLGILGGPLYTFYKIFTAVKLSEHLSAKFTKYNFVPVFWMAGDDHDFEEISYVNLVNKENELTKIIYSDGFEPQFNRGSVGDLNFLNSILEFKDKVQSEIRATEFSKNFFELIDNILIPGLSIKDSFFNLVYQIFDDTGLIIFNPQDVEVKKLLRPIFTKEIIDYKKHTKQLLLESAELDESYHAQVKIKPINLFMSDDSGRNLIEPIEDEFRLKGKRKRITKEELLNKIENEPERFSANVLLRPICEDYLFPTGFYIGGPGEISYYAQAIPLYKQFGLQHPIIFPRATATIVEKNIAKIFIKYNLSTKDFFKGNDALKEDLIKSLSDYNLENEFNRAEKSIDEALNKLSASISKVDSNLQNLTESTKGKLLHQLNVLRDKSMKSQEQKFDAALRQISKAQNVIYPNENLQERELTIINFVNKYGFDFFDWLYNELDITEFKHQILEI